MGSPKGFPKGFDFAGCVNVTLVLRDFQVLTGRIKGLYDQERKESYDFNHDYDKHKDDDKGKYDDKSKHDDKCCKPPKVDINVEIEEESKYILLELTRPSAAVNLSSVTCNIIGEVIAGLGLVVSGTTFPEGTCVAVNLDNVIYAGPGATFCDFPLNFGTDAAGAITLTAKK
jgi:hypothetical protein